MSDDVQARDGGVWLSPHATKTLVAVIDDAVGVLTRHGKPVGARVLELVDLLRVAATSAELMSAHGHEASRATREPSSFTTSSAVAAKAGCSSKTVVRAVTTGELPGFRHQGYLIDATTAAEWIERRCRTRSQC